MDIIIIALAHFFLDIPFHNCPLNKNKRGDKGFLLFHSVVYGLGVHTTLALLGVSHWANLCILVASHFVVDYARELMRDKEVSQKQASLLDQAAHMAINFALLHIGS